MTVHNCVGEISLVAVHPDFRYLGYGNELMEAAENKGRPEKVMLGVPSCREDIVPFFVKRGYKEMVSKPIDEIRKLYPEELAEKKITRDDIFWRIFMRKMEVDDDDDTVIPMLYGNVE